MLDDVYNRRILELAADIPRQGVFRTRTRHHRAFQALWLDRDGRSFHGWRCRHRFRNRGAGLRPGAGVLLHHGAQCVGSTASELRAMRETVRRMLKENGAPPAGRWEDLRVLEPVRDYKARHASTMLTFDAVVDAITQIEAKRAATRAAE